MSFIISGMGRSGTAFVARELNRSKTWDVRHEPDASMDAGTISKRFFGADHYGEVNSHLLFCMDVIRGVDRVLILRDPLDVAVSMIRRGHPPGDLMANNIAISAAMIDRYRRTGCECRAVPLYDFKRLTKNRAYLLRLANEVGISDLAEQDFVMEPANQSAGELDWDDLSRDIRGTIERPVRWFRQIYGRTLGWDLDRR